MKYFINDEEINFGDEFLHVKEGKFDDITATVTLEGKFTEKSAKNLIDLGVVKVKSDNPIKELDKNIKILEKMTEILKELIG